MSIIEEQIEQDEKKNQLKMQSMNVAAIGKVFKSVNDVQPMTGDYRDNLRMLK